MWKFKHWKPKNTKYNTKLPNYNSNCSNSPNNTTQYNLYNSIKKAKRLKQFLVMCNNIQIFSTNNKILYLFLLNISQTSL